MTSSTYGRITPILGDPDSKFPRCTSLLVEGKERALIDPGAGESVLAPLADSVDLVLNTHCHYDHISCNYLFPDATILTSPQEFRRTNSLIALAEILGITGYFGPEAAASWAKRASEGTLEPHPYSSAGNERWGVSTGCASGVYPQNVEMPLGDTTVVMLHMPGHSSGLSCPYFPREGLVYTSDIDLTSFGPWYASADGDPDQFAASARQLSQLDARVYVTGHHIGIVDREEYRRRLDRYLGVMEMRDERVAGLIREDVDPQDMTNQGVFYGVKYQEADPVVRMYEALFIEKHLRRLSKREPDLLPASRLERILRCLKRNGINPWG